MNEETAYRIHEPYCLNMGYRNITISSSGIVPALYRLAEENIPVTLSISLHVRVRFNIWLHPWADPNGQAYQVVQSLFAFGSGGVWGTGFAHGHPGLIPEVHTDFIFSAIAEELGLLGAAMVVLAYLLFFYRSIRIAMSPSVR